MGSKGMSRVGVTLRRSRLKGGDDVREGLVGANVSGKNDVGDSPRGFVDRRPEGDDARQHRPDDPRPSDVKAL